MDDNLTSHASYRISGAAALIGRVSNSSTQPGQNGGFSDGFLTNSCVDTCHSGQPGNSTDPKNPMKSIDYPPSEGYPAHPPHPPQIRLPTGSRRCRHSHGGASGRGAGGRGAVKMWRWWTRFVRLRFSSIQTAADPQTLSRIATAFSASSSVSPRAGLVKTQRSLSRVSSMAMRSSSIATHRVALGFASSHR